MPNENGRLFRFAPDDAVSECKGALAERPFVETERWDSATRRSGSRCSARTAERAHSRSIRPTAMTGIRFSLAALRSGPTRRLDSPVGGYTCKSHELSITQAVALKTAVRTTDPVTSPAPASFRRSEGVRLRRRPPARHRAAPPRRSRPRKSGAGTRPKGRIRREARLRRVPASST